MTTNQEDIIAGIIAIIVFIAVIYLAWQAWFNPEPVAGFDQCGERSSDIIVEQERIICENQNYNITGKNITVVDGVKTYCCPSPWIPNEDLMAGTLGPAGPMSTN